MITAISPIDGRYASKTEELNAYFSEAALIRYRLLIEVEWLIFLCNILKLEGTRELSTKEVEQLKSYYQKFTTEDAEAVKKIEKETNHDVKAVEYFFKQKIAKEKTSELSEFIHFACTSEDINNLSYSLMLKNAIAESILPSLDSVVEELKGRAQTYKKVAMLSRTHGQTASPTTVGKEFINFVARLERQINNPAGIDFLGKINGAVGNFNAHYSAFPEVDWQKASQAFIMTLGLTPNMYTAQIEPHDFNAEIFDNLRRVNTVLLDFCRDIWTYISHDYFKQKTKKGEVGSSTMPHKVNPIDFENAEGNIGIANSLFSHFSEKLPISRMQRDLSDSTVFRNVGVAFAHSLIAYKSILRGISKLEINEKKLAHDLDNNWEVLAEPIQTVMRKYKVEKPYEKLKELTRGKKIDKKSMQDFVNKLEIPEAEKKSLSNLTPGTYIGLAVELVDKYLEA